MAQRKSPSFVGLKPASNKASAAARACSRKQGTTPEMLLRDGLWKAGCRYRRNVTALPGRPDLVFPKAKLAIFCDGDFWHGREWETRRAKLERGSNPGYWIAKIERNRERDHQNDEALHHLGFTVLRFWESDLKLDPAAAVKIVLEVLQKP